MKFKISKFLLPTAIAVASCSFYATSCSSKAPTNVIVDGDTNLSVQWGQSKSYSYKDKSNNDNLEWYFSPADTTTFPSLVSYSMNKKTGHLVIDASAAPEGARETSLYNCILTVKHKDSVVQRLLIVLKLYNKNNSITSFITDTDINDLAETIEPGGDLAWHADAILEQLLLLNYWTMYDIYEELEVTNITPTGFRIQPLQGSIYGDTIDVTNTVVYRYEIATTNGVHFHILDTSLLCPSSQSQLQTLVSDVEPNVSVPVEDVVGIRLFSQFTHDVPKNFLFNYINLTSINNLSFGPKVRKIEDNFLYKCDNFDGTIDFSEAKNLQKIGNGFMQECKEFNTEVNLSSCKNLVSIGAGFLLMCEKLNSLVTLPEGLQSIGDSFMNSCTSFNKNITIPGTVTSISSQEFAYRWESFNTEDSYMTFEQKSNPFTPSVLSDFAFSKDDSKITNLFRVKIPYAWAQEFRDMFYESSSHPFRRLRIIEVNKYE